MGPLRRSATTSVLLVAVLLLGGGATAAAARADAPAGQGLDTHVPGQGAWLAAGAAEWWRGLAERRDPQGARQLWPLPLGTVATTALLAAVLAWLAPGTRPRRARLVRARAPAGPRSPPRLRLA
jgi:hypothetical protein